MFKYYGKGQNLNVQMEHIEKICCKCNIEKDMGRFLKIMVHKKNCK
jgi:hypothetical protein